MDNCRRGEIWLVDFDPQLGPEIKKRRPALILSVDQLNDSAAGVIVVVPGTSTEAVNPKTGQLIYGYCRVDPSAANGLGKTTYFIAQQVKSAARTRLMKKIGVLEAAHRKAVADRIATLLGLYDDLQD